MRIAYVNTEIDKGGAARAMQRSIRALTQLGHEGVLITLAKEGKSNTPVVRVQDHTPARQAMISNVAHRLYNSLYVVRNRTEMSNTLFWTPSVGFDVAAVLAPLDVDLINIHWTSYFLSLESLKRVFAMGKPVVFTLHDMAHFTGGCHYAADCESLVKGCDSCGQLKADPLHLTRAVFSRRAQLYAAGLPWAIAPSRWLANEARQSGVFASDRVSYISNGLDLTVFAPQDRVRARRAFGIPEDARVILFGAFDNAEHRKGFDLLADATRAMIDQPEARALAEGGKLYVMGFGNNLPLLDLPGVRFAPTGYIDDDHKLAQAYSAADLTAIPSRQDNQPNTMLESLACGTPVVGFNIGGLPDCVEEGVNGALAEPFAAADFAGAMIRVLSNTENCVAMRRAARVSAEKIADPFDHAMAYADIFRRAVLAQQPFLDGDFALLRREALTERTRAVESPTMASLLGSLRILPT